MLQGARFAVQGFILAVRGFRTLKDLEHGLVSGLEWLLLVVTYFIPKVISTTYRFPLQLCHISLQYYFAPFWEPL